MAETQPGPHLVRFGAFEADVRTGELRKDGVKLKFGGQPFQVLIILLERPGSVVTREELQKRLWPDTFVDVERNLNTAVNKIREVLGDSADTPRFIETLPRRGYRFIAVLDPTPDTGAVNSNDKESCSPVDLETSAFPQVDAGNGGETEGRKTRSKDQSRKWFWRWLLPVAAILALWATIWYQLRPLPPHITEYQKLTRDGQPKELVGTDGTRLYINQFKPRIISQVSVAGGEPAPVSLPVKNPFLRDISPDGSTFMVLSLDDSNLWSVGVLGGSLRRLTNTQTVSEAWSPDGNSVAYSTTDGEIFRARNDWSEVQRLTPSGVPAEKRFVEDLAWAPDGETLRFTSDQELWEISSHGSNQRKLLQGWNSPDRQCCGRWTPDGAFYIFLSGDSLLRPGNLSTGSQLWAIDERRGWLRRPSPQPIQLTSGPTHWGRPFPSRDGKRIFARGVTIRGELERYDSQSRQFQPFLGGISAEFVSFSNDGKSVAYVSYPEGVLWKANRDGSSPVQLTDPPLYPKTIRWSPDGTQIAFFESNSKGGRPSTFVISSEGGKPQQLRPEANEPMRDANWSPDGRKLIFDTCGCGELSSPKVIRVLDIASRQVTALPESEGMISPRWSPDGRFIAVLSTAKGFDPRVYDLESKRWSVLPVGSVDWPTWSKDSRSVYFLRTLKDPAVIRVSIPSGKIEKVVDLNGFQVTGWFSLWFGLDPTDAPLLLRNVGTEDIYALTLDRK